MLSLVNAVTYEQVCILTKKINSRLHERWGLIQAMSQFYMQHPHSIVSRSSTDSLRSITKNNISNGG